MTESRSAPESRVELAETYLYTIAHTTWATPQAAKEHALAYFTEAARKRPTPEPLGSTSWFLDDSEREGRRS